RGLGEDAAADTHEHREQRATETEALEHGRGVGVVEEQYERGAEQTETDGHHAADTTGTEGDPHGSTIPVGSPRRRRHPDVSAGGQRHPDVADERRETCPEYEEHGSTDPYGDATLVHWKHQEKEEDDRDEHAKRLELPVEVGSGAFLNGLGDFLHSR